MQPFLIQTSSRRPWLSSRSHDLVAAPYSSLTIVHKVHGSNWLKSSFGCSMHVVMMRLYARLLIIPEFNGCFSLERSQIIGLRTTHGSLGWRRSPKDICGYGEAATVTPIAKRLVRSMFRRRTVCSRYGWHIAGGRSWVFIWSTMAGATVLRSLVKTNYEKFCF